LVGFLIIGGKPVKGGGEDENEIMLLGEVLKGKNPQRRKE